MKIPELDNDPTPKSKSKSKSKSVSKGKAIIGNKYSEEYDLIVTSNKNITNEFIKLLQEYRLNKVNQSNLDLEQLYSPQAVYDYLRNNHWKNGIPKDFLTDWVRMANTGYRLKFIKKPKWILTCKININYFIFFIVNDCIFFI